MSSPAVPESQPKLVQVDRHTYEVNVVREGGFGKVWLLKRRTKEWDWIYGPENAVKTFNLYEDEQEAVIERELGNWISLQSRHIVSLIKIVRLNFQLGALMLLKQEKVGRSAAVTRCCMLAGVTARQQLACVR